MYGSCDLFLIFQFHVLECFHFAFQCYYEESIIDTIFWLLFGCLFVCSLSKTGSREPLLQSVPSSSFFVFIDAFHSKLRVNVGKYRESQISSKNSNFGLYHPNNCLGDLFQEMILRNPQVLYVLRNLEKFEKFHKNTFFIREIAAIFSNFQGSSTSAQKLLLT